MYWLCSNNDQMVSRTFIQRIYDYVFLGGRIRVWIWLKPKDIFKQISQSFSNKKDTLKFRVLTDELVTTQIREFADLKNISNLERTCSSKRFMISKVLLTYFQGPLKNFFLSHTTEARRSLLKSSRQQNLWHWHIFSNNFTFFSILIKFWICSLLTFVNDWGWSDPAMFSYHVISLSLPYAVFQFSSQSILRSNTTNCSAHP